MSRRRKKKRNRTSASLHEYRIPDRPPVKQRPITQSGLAPDDVLDVLVKQNNCDMQSFKPMTFTDNQEDEIEWMIANLPTLPYVKKQYLAFMFSNGLTCGDEAVDEERLKPFLFKQNIKGVPNYQVIRQAIMHAKLYGKCGLRWLSEEDGMVIVPHQSYITVFDDDEKYGGIKRPICYALSYEEGKPISLGSKSIKLDEAEFLDKGRLVSKNKDVIIELPENFVNLRDDLGTEDGVSCLAQDMQRLQILCNAYKRLNYDINYDGPGRILLKVKDDVFGGGAIDHSAGEIVNNMTVSKTSAANKVKQEAAEIAREIKSSSSDQVISLSSVFEDIEHIPRVTKATEFLDYLTKKEGSIIAQCLGITPELIGMGDVSGNVSMEKIIDNATMNTIVPEREYFATQFSPMIAGHLGVEKVFFDKYELKQTIDRSSEIYKLALSAAQFEAMENVGNRYDEVKNSISELILRLAETGKGVNLGTIATVD